MAPTKAQSIELLTSFWRPLERKKCSSVPHRQFLHIQGSSFFSPLQINALMRLWEHRLPLEYSWPWKKHFTFLHNFYIIMQMAIISAALAGDCPYFCHYGATLTVRHHPTNTNANAKPAVGLREKENLQSSVLEWAVTSGAFHSQPCSKEDPTVGWVCCFRPFASLHQF